MNAQVTSKDIDEFFTLGRQIVLPDGTPGVFHGWASGSKSVGLVCRGNIKNETSGLLTYTRRALVRANFETS